MQRYAHDTQCKDLASMRMLRGVDLKACDAFREEKVAEQHLGRFNFEKKKLVFFFCHSEINEIKKKLFWSAKKSFHSFITLQNLLCFPPTMIKSIPIPAVLPAPLALRPCVLWSHQDKRGVVLAYKPVG